jgi:hypothetical protein
VLFVLGGAGELSAGEGESDQKSGQNEAVA